jgi:hypothetical protein
MKLKLVIKYKSNIVLKLFFFLPYRSYFSIGIREKESDFTEFFPVISSV